MMKFPVIILFLLIVFSLVQGMYYLSKDSGQQDKVRLAKTLTLRISLSFALFFMLLVGYLAGWIQPHGL